MGIIKLIQSLLVPFGDCLMAALALGNSINNMATNISAEPI